MVDAMMQSTEIQLKMNSTCTTNCRECNRVPPKPRRNKSGSEYHWVFPQAYLEELDHMLSVYCQRSVPRQLCQ